MGVLAGRCGRHRGKNTPSAVRTAPPRLSAEVFVIPVGGSGYIIYAPVRRAAFIANTEVVRFLADIEKGQFDDSAGRDGSLVSFLRRLEILDAKPEEPPVTRATGNPRPVALTLLLTTACNLRCAYCYASAGDVPTRHMSLETAKRGIDFIVRNARAQDSPYFEVAFHGGGEPTLNWEVLTGAVDHAKRQAVQFGLHLTTCIATNGVLTERRIEWIAANVSAANVSFDGLPAIHDRHRLTRSGRGSSHRVVQTLRRFDEGRFRYGIRVTVTEDTVAALPDSVEYICSNFRPDAIQTEPVYGLGRGRGERPIESGEFVAAFRAAQQRAARCSREISFSAARLGTLSNHFCAVSRDSFCLSPDGNVTACYEACSETGRWAGIFFYGRPSANGGGYEFDPARLDRLRLQTVDCLEHCRACFAKWSCAGDCYYKALEVNGPGGFSGAGRCEIIRELTKDQILARIAASGGIFWYEGTPAPGGCAAGGFPCRRVIGEEALYGGKKEAG